MKTTDTRHTGTSLKTAPIVGIVAALLFAVSAFFAVLDGPGQMTAAAVTKSETGADASNKATAEHRTEDAPEKLAREKSADAVEPAATGSRSAKRIGTGEASYYGARFAGRKTANGERFDPTALTAAHRSLPFGSKVRVTNAANGRSVVVRVNDRGPYAHGRLIDLSRQAAERIGMIRSGTAKVELELIS